MFGLQYRHIDYLVSGTANGTYSNDLVNRNGFLIPPKYKGAFLGMTVKRFAHLYKKLKKGKAFMGSNLKALEEALLSGFERDSPGLSNYRNRFLVCVKRPTAKSDLRHTIQSQMKRFINGLFKPLRDELPSCQFRSASGSYCSNRPLETAHMDDDASELFDAAADRCKRPCAMIPEGVVWDLEEVFVEFLKKHRHTLRRKDVVKFLCNAHHQEHHRLQKSGSKEKLEDFMKRVQTYPK